MGKPKGQKVGFGQVRIKLRHTKTNLPVKALQVKRGTRTTWTQSKRLMPLPHSCERRACTPRTSFTFSSHQPGSNGYESACYHQQGNGYESKACFMDHPPQGTRDMGESGRVWMRTRISGSEFIPYPACVEKILWTA